MTEKRITKRMEALTNLAHYSTEICLKIPTEFLKNKECEFSFTKKLQDSITCLINDKNKVTIHYNKENTIIHIKAK